MSCFSSLESHHTTLSCFEALNSRTRLQASMTLHLSLILLDQQGHSLYMFSMLYASWELSRKGMYETFRIIDAIIFLREGDEMVGIPSAL